MGIRDSDGDVLRLTKDKNLKKGVKPLQVKALKIAERFAVKNQR